MKKRKIRDINEAANQLASIIEKHLEPLSPLERKRRIKKARARVSKAVSRREIKTILDLGEQSWPRIERALFGNNGEDVGKVLKEEMDRCLAAFHRSTSN